MSESLSQYFNHYFEIINIREDCIEIKSKFHFWRIIKVNEVFYLHHKHEAHYSYHVQCKNPFYSLSSIRKYIQKHDRYIQNTSVT